MSNTDSHTNADSHTKESAALERTDYITAVLGIAMKFLSEKISSGEEVILSEIVTQSIEIDAGVKRVSAHVLEGILQSTDVEKNVEILDDMVHDIAEENASKTNNMGVKAQEDLLNIEMRGVYTSTDLDSLVVDFCSNQASDINNDSLTEQVRFLMSSGVKVDDIIEAITDEDTPAP